MESTTGAKAGGAVPAKAVRVSARRHDLDALRAAAMLLGVVYHASLSFAEGAGWMVHDDGQGRAGFVFQAFVHGFRMPLFILVSGFFTAMLWRQKGLQALIWHRFRRVAVPLMLGMVTVVPAVNWAAGWAIRADAEKAFRVAQSESAKSSVWAAIRDGDRAALEVHLKGTGSLTNLHPLYGMTPLTWAAGGGRPELVKFLLERGAPVGGRNRDGGTALHAAAFLGRERVLDVLLAAGADVNAASASGEVPLESAGHPWGVVQMISGYLGLRVEEATVMAGKAAVVERLRAAGAKGRGGGGVGVLERGWLRSIGEAPVFGVLWFLWFLLWLVGMFSVYAWVMDRWKGATVPAGWTLAGARWVWWLPVTLVPGWFMGFGNGEFGPDTSLSLLPMPHVLAYYAVFFFFGAFYFDARDEAGELGRGWRWILPVALLGVFPLGLEMATGVFGMRDTVMPKGWQRPVAVVLEGVYAWMMAYGCMGMFRALLTRENGVIRYLSDSSYWLYVAHLPLTLAMQAWICRWPGPGWLKLGLMSAVLTGFLLLTYQFLVRHTWVGRMLNGPRERRGEVRGAASGS